MVERVLEMLQSELNNAVHRREQIEQEIAETETRLQVLRDTLQSVRKDIQYHSKVLQFAERERV